jgi:diacylglycerol O-acyltransferase
MTNRERISGVDTAWLRMEQPTNLMMIVGVMMFAEPLDAADVRRALEARFLAYPRFRQRAVQEPGGAWWETDESFDIGHHLRRVRLRGMAGKKELEALVSKLASTPLDFDRPLWEFHLVENYAGGAALVMRIHHCYADGIALIQVLLSMTHESAAGSLALRPPPPSPPRARREAPAEGDFWQQVFKPLGGALAGATMLGRGLLDQGRGLAENPQAAADALQALAKKGFELAAEVAKLATLGPDATTRLKGPLGKRKRAAWAQPLPLEEVKAVGKALGCSINDVLLSMAAGSIRDYLEACGDSVQGLEIRAIVPVNLRPAGGTQELGNRFGLVFLTLPIGMAHPLERLYEVRRRMRELKGSWQPAIALALLNAVGMGPRALQDQVTHLLSDSATAVMTNVPGPQQPLYFAGRRIVEQDFWVPQSGGIGMGVSILSYDGRIQFGIITDEGLVADPQRIVDRFGEEFDRLMWITLMSPWGDDADSPPPPDERSTKASQPPAKVPKRFRNL